VPERPGTSPPGLVPPPDADLAPSIAVVFLLPDCQLDCPFCGSERGFDTLPRGVAERLVERLGAAGVRGVVLGGGEPCLWPHGLFGLAERATGCGLEVQVATNGIALPAGFERSPAVARYMLPLDAANEPVHDRLRAAPGHAELVWRRLAALAAARRPASIATVVTAENLGELPALAERLGAHDAGRERIHAWHLYRFTPIGRGGARHAPRFTLERDAFHVAAERVRAAALPFPVYGRSELFATRAVEFIWHEREALATAHGPLACRPWWPSAATALR